MTDQPQDPISGLMDDHRRIEKVLTALEAKLAGAGDFPADFVQRALDFFVEFADKFHHFKEEEALFPVLAERGVPVEGGPIGVMLEEHTLGRSLLAAIREKLPAAREGDEAARASIRQCAGDYALLLRNHIWKEDNVLFAMARRVLDGAAVQRVEERVAQVAAESVAGHRAFADGVT